MIDILLLGALVVVLVVLIAEVFRKSSIFFLCKSSTHSATKQPKKGTGKSLDDSGLPSGLSRELVPKHVAIIMDGNRRWAKNKGLPSMAGHTAGARSLMKLVPLCCKWGIKVLTVYAFSSENWVRPRMEVDFLMKLMERTLREEQENFMRHGVRVSVIGDSRKLPESVQKWVTKITEATKNNPRLHLILAINYGGRNDIVQACQSISHKVKDGLIKPEDVDETVICQELQTKCTEFPYPDLLIRTSGELRISNFLIWELAYTEFYFDESLWPDFGEKEFAKALHSFQRRQRRFGGQDAKNK
ncbi:dehydrodolichyl diphosphate synthase 2-like [Papaver somniferum]|uniref:dehydrodolichyl diphosphate synthase 2-like n=1 Tax=Papaver somniferum TaxID=3469 RepID=UPI000E6F94EF|nr:dehydrodolichyl diphosphate synthase 2-like [Papaver somniferum]